MSAAPPSPAQALLALQRQLVEGIPPEPPTLAAIASWRLACGDGAGAARWRRWSLQPPQPEALIEALRDLLLQVGHPHAAQQLGGATGWAAVQLALALGQGEQAQRLQAQALAAAIPLAAEQRLQLVSAWRQRDALRPALELVERMPGVEQSAPLCHLAAFLLQQLQEPAAAALWWDRSLAIAPDQLAVVAHRARNAAALGELGRAQQLAHTLLQHDPNHPTGQAVLLSSLEQLGARASLRQLLAARHRHGHQTAPELQQALERWWRPRRRRQRVWRLALPLQLRAKPLLLLAPPQPLPAETLRGKRRIGLLASQDGLELAGNLDPTITSGEVWDLASREPLITSANLQRLLPPGWQLRRWHQWQVDHHGALEAVVPGRGWRRRDDADAATSNNSSL